MAGAPDTSDASFDLTPMIDVILLLIIFFMLSSQFASTELRPVDLPQEAGMAAPSETATARMVIDVARDGTYSVMGDPMPLDDLGRRLAAVHAAPGLRHSGIVVRADRNAPAGALNRLAERLAASKVANWSLAVAGDGS